MASANASEDLNQLHNQRSTDALEVFVDVFTRAVQRKRPGTTREKCKTALMAACQSLTHDSTGSNSQWES